MEADNTILTDIEKLKKDVRKNIVDYGLDERLSSDIIQLKRKLLGFVNTAKQQVEVPVKKDEPQLTTTKSEEELIKHFTGLDAQTIRKNKNFSDLVDNKVAFVRKDKNMLGNDPAPHKMTPGIQYQLDMSQFDTFETQHSKALDYFNNALYVIEEGGVRRFFVNPGGHDLSRFVKVVCTKDTGDTAAARERFESYRNGNDRSRNVGGMASWTLRKEGIDYVKKNFVDMTDVIEKIQNGQEDEAISSANAKSGRSTTIRDFQEKVQDIKEKKNLAPSVEAYVNIVKLIKSMRILKTMYSEGVRYSLVTNDSSSTNDKDEEFLDKIRNEIYMWEVAHQEKWVSTLLRKINKLLQDYAAKG
jgi:hypothetical protein